MLLILQEPFPVNGKFSSAQKAIYQLVLFAQKAAIEKVKAEIFLMIRTKRHLKLSLMD
jgi:hypothetical protein